MSAAAVLVAILAGRGGRAQPPAVLFVDNRLLVVAILARRGGRAQLGIVVIVTDGPSMLRSSPGAAVGRSPPEQRHRSVAARGVAIIARRGGRAQLADMMGLLRDAGYGVAILARRGGRAQPVDGR